MPYINKVVYGSSTLIDLTADTVTPATLMQGYTAHDASGAAIVGTSTAGTMVIRDTQDSHGGTVREITAGSVVTGTKTITANGTYDVAEFADASVNVPSAEPELQAKTATPTESQQTVTPDSGYDGLSSVTVGAISGTYVGSQVPRFTLSEDWVVAPTEAQTLVMSDGERLEGGDIYVGAISPTYVGSGITRRSSTDLTASGATVTVPSGYYSAQASKAVSSGTAGTPTATKGTVSNHSVAVTPSVTNTAGYIAGGTKTGTAVTVSASELVSGTKSISASGNTDVTEYATASVPEAEASVSINSADMEFYTSGTRMWRVRPRLLVDGAGWVSQDAAGSWKSFNAVPSNTTVTPSTSAQTIGGANYMMEGAVTVAAMPTGTAGTPTATKGSVSNHSVSVTPSVTNTGGYITGGTKTGTAVTVSASELASGNKAITENGTGIDVVGYSTVSVDVPTATPTGTLTITANGTYDVTDYASAAVNVGGGTGGDITDTIRFFDYDGTLVASYSSVPASLPSVPAHSGLTNGTWNYTLAQVTTQFNAMGTCDVGANYDTSSGATEIDIVLQPERLHPYLSLAVNGTVTIDWGDGSTSTSTGTSLTTRKGDIEHEYAAAGSYTISISKTSGTGYSLFCTSNYLLLNKNASSASANRVYANCVKAVRVGADCTIGNYAFNYCSSLNSVSIPSNVTSIGNYAFCYCYSLASVSIPSNVTSIGAGAFSNCYGMAEYHILPTTPPTLANTNAFTYIQDDCVIYVPAASLADYQAATNWSTYASYMAGE